MIKLWDGKIREPNVLFLRSEPFDKRQGSHWKGADLVMEVVSPGDAGRDKVTKHHEYARAVIPEYWVVDPIEPSVTIFALPEPGGEYFVHGFFAGETSAQSATLAGFAAELKALFAEQEPTR